jgi:archaellum component FlaC
MSEIDQIKKEVADLRNEISEIKTILKDLTSKPFENLEDVFVRGFDKVKEAQTQLQELQNQLKNVNRNK